MAHVRNPSFFKVFLPDLSSNHLRIPPAFLKHMENEKAGRVFLEGPSGCTWCVQLVMSPGDGAWFMEGWKDFVADHSITPGDFLVFRYNGGSRFAVLVFDPTACEKEGAFLAKPCSSAGVFSENEEEKDRKDLVVKLSKDSTVMSLKRNMEREELLQSKKKKDAVGSDVLEGKEKSKPRTRKKCNGHSNFSTMRKNLSRSQGKDMVIYVPRFKSSMRVPEYIVKQEINVEEEEIICEKPTGSSETCTPIKCDKVQSKCLTLMRTSELPQFDEGRVRVLRMGSLLSQRRSVTEQELDKAVENAKSFRSKNPFFIVVMQEAYVYSSFFMSIPHTFVKEHLPDEKTKVILWDANGKPWDVVFLSYGKRGGFSGGWGKFSRAHNLEQGDVCIFELLKEYEMQVHIFRVVEEISPLRRIRKSEL